MRTQRPLKPVIAFLLSRIKSDTCVDSLSLKLCHFTLDSIWCQSECRKRCTTLGFICSLWISWVAASKIETEREAKSCCSFRIRRLTQVTSLPLPTPSSSLFSPSRENSELWENSKMSVFSKRPPFSSIRFLCSTTINPSFFVFPTVPCCVPWGEKSKVIWGQKRREMKDEGVKLKDWTLFFWHTKWVLQLLECEVEKLGFNTSLM